MDHIPQSSVSKAIDLLRGGHRLPLRLINDLTDQGYDVIGLHIAYLNKAA